MSSSHTSHSPDEGPLGYDALDYASIEIVVGGMANADGLLSLAACSRRWLSGPL